MRLLRKKDFEFIHWENDYAGSESFELVIYGKSESDCKKIKKQILAHQRIVENLIKLHNSKTNGFVRNYITTREIESILKEAKK